MRKKLILMTIALACATAQGAWAQSLAAPEKEIRAEDATVTGGILRTPLYKDSVMLTARRCAAGHTGKGTPPCVGLHG